MQRQELEQYLETTFEYKQFDDYCKNGLQVEGKAVIQKLAFGVSFNLPLLQEAIAWQADALCVHHGIFAKGLFSLSGPLKERVKLLLQHDLSLFGIHLPLDAHRELGNNARLFSYFEGEIEEPYDVGFIGQNVRQYTLTHMLDVFHQRLHSEQSQILPDSVDSGSLLSPKCRHGFWYLDFGPAIPQKVAIVSGGAARYYQEAVNKGIDTFICGNLEEPTPALAYETKTNFINIGHYWSEKAGVWALQQAIRQQFDVETRFIEVENMI